MNRSPSSNPLHLRLPAVGLLALATWSGALALPPAKWSTLQEPDGSPRTLTLEQGVATTSVHFASPGRVYVCAGSDGLDPGLRVARRGAPAGQVAVVLEDRDSGGGNLAFLELELRGDEELEITVFDESDAATGSGSASLFTSLAAETDATREQAASFSETLSQVLDLEPDRAAGELPFVLELLPAQGADLSPRMYDQLRDLSRLPEMLRTSSLELGRRRLMAQYWDRHLPIDHGRRLLANVRLAIALKQSGRSAEARPLEEEVLAQRLRTLEPGHRDVLLARLNLGATLFQLGELELAGHEFETLLAQLPPGRPLTDPLVANAHQNHAAVLLRRGFVREAATIFEGLLASQGPDLGGLAYTDVRRNLGKALLGLGEPERAEACLSRLFAEQRAALPSQDQQLLRTQLELAVALKSLGDVEAARVLEEGTLAAQLATLPDDHLDVQVTRVALAETMLRAGDPERARRLMERVVEQRARALSPDDPELRSARVSLAHCLMDLGHIEDARSMLQRIPGLAGESPRQDFDSLRGRELLALSWLFLGDPDRARELEESVLAERTRLLPQAHPDLQVARVNLAWILLAQGQGEQARALQLTDEMIRATRARLEGLSGQRGPRELQAMAMRSEQELADALSIVRLAQIETTSTLETAVFELVETARAVAMSQRRLVGLFERANASPELNSALEELRQARAAVVRASKQGDLFGALRTRDRAERKLQRGIRQLPEVVSELPNVSADAIRTALRPSEAALGLWRHERWTMDSESRRVESEGDHYLAFVLRPDAPVRRVELGPAAEIDAAVEAWRSELLRGQPRGIGMGDDPVDDPAAQELIAGRRLRELVIDPLDAALEDIRVCHVALDDALFVVPLDTLPLSEEDRLHPGGVLGDRLQLIVRAGLKELTRPVRRTGAPALLALGGIDYDSPPAGEVASPSEPSQTSATPTRTATWKPSFTYLPATDSEVRTLAHYFGRAHPERPHDTLTGSEATRAAFEARAGSASFLHLATHAYFAPESVPSMLDGQTKRAPSALDPRAQAFGLAPLLLCGLVFAGGNRPGPEGDAGRMTADELSGLDLSRCDLAVLSACETALGVRRAGQGVASLQSALHAAGVRTMITSLWKVPDQASKELMGHFYRFLWVEGRSTADALWAAKQRLRSEVGPDRRPRYATRDWSGWVLSGQPD